MHCLAFFSPPFLNSFVRVIRFITNWEFAFLYLRKYLQNNINLNHWIKIDHVLLYEWQGKTDRNITQRQNLTKEIDKILSKNIQNTSVKYAL